MIMIWNDFRLLSSVMAVENRQAANREKRARFAAFKARLDAEFPVATRGIEMQVCAVL